MTAGTPVLDHDGRRGTLEAAPEGGPVAVRLDTGERVDVPADLLAPQPDGTYRVAIPFASVAGGMAYLGVRQPAPAATAAPDSWGDDLTVPLVEERARVGAEGVETGRLRVHRTVEHVEEAVDVVIHRDAVEVERVPVGRFVEAPEPIREEGDVTIVPVYEEVLVVEKRLLLREEVRLVRRRTEERVQQPVALRRAHVDVERVAPTSGVATPPAGRSGDAG